MLNKKLLCQSLPSHNGLKPVCFKMDEKINECGQKDHFIVELSLGVKYALLGDNSYQEVF